MFFWKSPFDFQMVLFSVQVAFEILSPLQFSSGCQSEKHLSLEILSSVWNIEKVMWGQAGDLHFNSPEITIQRGDSGQGSRKGAKSLDERKKQEKLERERYIVSKPER